VEVAAVDEGYLDRLPRELQRGVQATEAAADDDDAVRRAIMQRRPARRLRRAEFGGAHAASLEHQRRARIGQVPGRAPSSRVTPAR
jgi:hypothetical protein